MVVSVCAFECMKFINMCVYVLNGEHCSVVSTSWVRTIKMVVCVCACECMKFICMCLCMF
jgi:hypothetical protein